MLSEEEKKAIEILENEKSNLYVLTQTKFITCTVEQAKTKREAINTVLNLIIKQSNILNKIEEYAKGMNDKELLLILKSNEIDELINSCKKGGLLNE